MPCEDPSFPSGGWIVDTDADLGDIDDIYDVHPTDPDDNTTAPGIDEAILDDDADYTTDANGCVNGVEVTVWCYADVAASPPKTKKRRRIRLRHLPPLKRIKKVTPKVKQNDHSPGGGSD